MEETTGTEKMPWPMCERCLSRELCTENRRRNATHHVLSYCLAQITRDLEAAFVRGQVFLFPAEIAREAFMAADRVNAAAAALRRIAYLHELQDPRPSAETMDRIHGRG